MTENPQKCQKCGSPVTPGMKFCESCGAKIEASPACPKCGAAVAPGVKFCESCGALVDPAAPAEVAETPAKPSVKAEEPVKVEEKKTIPVPEEKPVPPAPQVKAEEKTAPAPAPVKEPAKIETVKEVAKETGSKKPASRTTLIIAGIIILALLGAAVYFVGLPMLSGSGTPLPTQQQPQVTAGQGSSSSASSTTADASQAGTVSLTAGPTDVPPANRALIIDVERNAISHDITVTFQGGEGQYGVRELAITLTRSDGTVETKSLTHLERGSSSILKGTEKSDRVEVTANFYNGETYKVIDKVFEYKKRVGSSG
jgi:hypothetical protein